MKVHERLRALGLTLEILVGALEAGVAAAALCSPNHPPNWGGLSLWAEAVRWLRETLIPKGWRSDNSYNFPTVVNRDRTIAIAIARGDAGTGDEDEHPSTEYRRGPVTVRAVEMNGVLPFPHLPPDYGKKAPDPDALLATWLLLHYRKDDQLVCELSYPVTINESGFVETWGQRIILTPISLDGARLTLDEPPVNPDVPVKRRA